MGRSLCILISLALALGISLISTEARKMKCPAERDRQFETCAQQMGFLGDHSFRVPKNQTAVDKFCSELKESIICIQSYSRDCLQGFSKQILTSLLKRGKQQHSLICSDGNSKRDFQRKMSCLADEKIETFHRLMDASVARFEHILYNVKTDAKLVSLCCSYQIFDRDLNMTLEKLCGRTARTQGKSTTADYISRIVSGTTGEFLNLICDNHKSMEECKVSKKTGAVVPQLEDVTQRVQSGKLTPKSKSLVPVLLEILELN